MKKFVSMMIITFIFLSLITQAVFTAKESHHEIELIVFSAEWCKASPKAIDIVKEIAESSEFINYRVIKYEEEPEEFESFGIDLNGLPITVVIIDGEITDVLDGAFQLDSRILEVIEEYMEEVVTSNGYIIDENQSIDKDFIVEGDVEIKEGAIVTFSNCRVEVSEGFRIGEDSKVLFKNCRIGESKYQYRRAIWIKNAQLTLDNCIIKNVDIDLGLDSNVLIKDSDCDNNSIYFWRESGAKIIIENSNVDSLSIYMSDMTIENLTQGFISNYKLKNNNSELIILDSTIDHIDLWDEGGDIKIQNVSCSSIIIHISDEEERILEVSNSKTEWMDTIIFEGTINIDKVKQGFNTESEIYSENGKFHLKITQSEILKWTLQTMGPKTGDPATVNVKEAIIAILVPAGKSIINFIQSDTPNKILNSLDCWAYHNPAIKGSVLIDDAVEISFDTLGTTDGNTFTRFYPVFVKYGDGPLENISVKILENGEEVWSGRTDTEGYVEPVIVFTADNLNSGFKIKLEYDGLSYSKDISLKTSTPLVFDEQVLVPEFGQVKDNKILIYGFSVVVIFVIALILVYCLKKKK